MGIKIFIYIVLFLSSMIESRPISYSGGSTIMAFSDNMKDSFYYHYSPSYKYSIGLEVLDDKIIDNSYSILRTTYLFNRKNETNSQRNIYLESGFTMNNLKENFFGLHGDWETRRLFLGFGTRKINNTINYSSVFFQAGFAPYLGEYGDLHTWIMLKSKKNSITDEWNSYPVIKFFKGNFLIELGHDDDLELDAHLMYRF
jgi:hypothetical protein